MGRKNTNKTIGTKKTVDDQKNQLNEARKIYPYDEKKCYECEIQECPEEK
jgi:hypothetical protein